MKATAKRNAVRELLSLVCVRRILGELGECGGYYRFQVHAGHATLAHETGAAKCIKGEGGRVLVAYRLDQSAIDHSCQYASPRWFLRNLLGIGGNAYAN